MIDPMAQPAVPQPQTGEMFDKAMAARGKEALRKPVAPAAPIPTPSRFPTTRSLEVKASNVSQADLASLRDSPRRLAEWNKAASLPAPTAAVAPSPAKYGRPLSELPLRPDSLPFGQAAAPGSLPLASSPAGPSSIPIGGDAPLSSRLPLRPGSIPLPAFPGSQSPIPFAAANRAGSVPMAVPQPGAPSIPFAAPPAAPNLTPFADVARSRVPGPDTTSAAEFNVGKTAPRGPFRPGSPGDIKGFFGPGAAPAPPAASKSLGEILGNRTSAVPVRPTPAAAIPTPAPFSAATSAITTGDAVYPGAVTPTVSPASSVSPSAGAAAVPAATTAAPAVAPQVASGLAARLKGMAGGLVKGAALGASNWGLDALMGGPGSWYDQNAHYATNHLANIAHRAGTAIGGERGGTAADWIASGVNILPRALEHSVGIPLTALGQIAGSPNARTAGNNAADKMTGSIGAAGKWLGDAWSNRTPVPVPTREEELAAGMKAYYARHANDAVQEIGRFPMPAAASATPPATIGTALSTGSQSPSTPDGIGTTIPGAGAPPVQPRPVPGPLGAAVQRGPHSQMGNSLDAYGQPYDPVVAGLRHGVMTADSAEAASLNANALANYQHAMLGGHANQTAADADMIRAHTEKANPYMQPLETPQAQAVWEAANQRPPGYLESRSGIDPIKMTSPAQAQFMKNEGPESEAIWSGQHTPREYLDFLHQQGAGQKRDLVHWRMHQLNTQAQIQGDLADKYAEGWFGSQGNAAQRAQAAAIEDYYHNRPAPPPTYARGKNSRNRVTR